MSNFKNRLAKLEAISTIPKIPDDLPELTVGQLEAIIAGETDSPLLMTLADRQPLTDSQVKAIMAGRSIDELTDKELIFLIVGYGEKPLLNS